jgi:glycosyltransferase involved in cell wall biosynthesis
MQSYSTTVQQETAPCSPVAVIPTYNNAGTLASVISETSAYIKDIIVVNDGSTDDTKNILESIRASGGRITIINFDENKGKGFALRAAFVKANELGFTHVITLDADGQHYPSDLPLFLEKVLFEPETLWIGDRVLVKEKTGEPARSAAGRKFGAFWYKFITGVALRDTQCGFRVYPLASVNGLDCKGARFEFEQEILVKAAWNGIVVRPVPVHLFYVEPSKRVSHFRPVRDFMRIFGVNSKAALIKLFLPFLIVDMPGATWRQKVVALFKYELRAHTTPKKAAFSLSLGVFIGILPIYFFQVALLVILSLFIKINRPLAFLGVSVSSAPFLPFIIALAIAIGKIVVPSVGETAFTHGRYGTLLTGGVHWFFGSIVLAIVLAGTCWAVSYPLFLRLRKGK